MCESYSSELCLSVCPGEYATSDLRWRIVYQHLGMGLSCRDVAKNLNVDPSTVSRVVYRFDQTGSVDPAPRKGVSSKLSNYDEFIIIENLLERPGMYLHELQYEIRKITGTEVQWNLR